MNSDNRKSAFKFTGIGIIIGIIITCLIVFIMNTVKGNPIEDVFKPNNINVSENFTEKFSDTEGSLIPETSSEITGNTENSVTASDTWQKDTIYNGGDTVIYSGKRFEAKWWTQGETPSENSDGPWKFIENAYTIPESEEPEETDDGLPDLPAKADAEDFKIVGYYPSWEPDKIKSIQYDNLTHINYAFAIPNTDGTLKPLENEAAAKKIIKAAHKKGVKVLLAVGGWSYNEIPLEPNFVSSTATPELVSKFADEIVAMADKYGFDGVDMDWEHPRRDGNSSKQYEMLMTNLAQQLHSKGKLLTSAVLSGVNADGGVYYDSAAHTDAVISCVDWFNVMAYDGGDGDRHSSYDFAVNSANYWKNTRKMPANKVVLGVPFYGRPSWKTYAEILAQNPEAYNTDVSMINGIEAHYNGIPTIQKKTQWASENVGGVMIWEISQDSSDKKTSLINAIADTARKNGKIK